MEISKEKRYVELGNFLKNRRSRLKPEMVGLPSGSRRHTPGLRREEVTLLAGIGLTWYTWLEQGREIKVSNEVLDSLAQVFMLSKEERLHLYALANKTLPKDELYNTYQPVNETLIHVLGSLNTSYCPAYYMDYYWNIIAWNKTAAAVFGDFSQIPIENRNVMYLMFCHSEYMALFCDWEYHAKGIIARFHGAMAQHIDDVWFTEFVERLKRKNNDFAMWWSMYDIHGMFSVIKEIHHPLVGDLIFEFSSFDVSDNHGLKLVLHTPVDDTLVKIKSLIK